MKQLSYYTWNNNHNDESGGLIAAQVILCEGDITHVFVQINLINGIFGLYYLCTRV